MSCRNKMSWLLWTLTLIQKLWFWLQYKKKILLLFAKILMFWYSITFLIYDSAEPKQTRQKLFGKLIKETLMGRFLHTCISRETSLGWRRMHSILFTTLLLSSYFSVDHISFIQDGVSLHPVIKNNWDSCMKKSAWQHRPTSKSSSSIFGHMWYF